MITVVSQTKKRTSGKRVLLPAFCLFALLLCLAVLFAASISDACSPAAGFTQGASLSLPAPTEETVPAPRETPEDAAHAAAAVQAPARDLPQIVKPGSVPISAVPEREAEPTPSPVPTQNPAAADSSRQENYADWAAIATAMDFSGDWRQDLLNLAASQTGYLESQKDHVYYGGEYRGYTRYGGWYGVPYGDWCAMFVAFCLHYAGIPESAMPRSSVCQVWIDLLKDSGQFRAPADYEPQGGDLVFFDRNGDGVSTHMGIFCRKYLRDDGVWIFETIEGNTTNSVRVVDYVYPEKSVCGYGVLPAQPKIPAPDRDEILGEGN